MNGMDRLGPLAPLAPLASRLGRIRARSWVLVGVAGIVLIGVIAAAAVLLLSWLWGQAPAVIDAGKRLGGEAAAQVEQAAPGVRERVEQSVPGLREQLSRWIPALAPVPAQDVSGADIGPVARYPGLLRSRFLRDGQAVEVGFAGAAPFDAVLAHYVQGFAAAGYTQEIVAAAPDEERHRFVRDRKSFELALTRRPSGHVELQLKHSTPP